MCKHESEQYENWLGFALARAGKAEERVREMEGGWHSVSDCLPKLEEDLGGIVRSRPVLLYMGTQQFVGYLQQWDDNEFPVEWKLAGRDGYGAESVTHWRPLPPPPDNAAKRKGE